MNNRLLRLSAAVFAAVSGAQIILAQAPAAPATPPAAAATAAAPAANPNHGPVMTALRAQFVSVRDRVLNIAESVPEDKYDWRPTPETRSFREQIQHLAGEGYLFLGPLGSVPGVTPPTNAQIEALRSKADVMKALRDSYDHSTKLIDNLTEAAATEMVAGRGRGGAMSPRWNAIVSLIIDNMDHYGNLVTMVRINGMVPPGRGGARGGGARGGPPAGAPAAPAGRGQ